MSKTLIKFFSELILACTCLLTVPCHAELGGLANRDAVLIQEQSPLVSNVPSLGIYLFKSPSGTQIKEYVNAENTVVAVTWQGPSLPNLRQLLGAYFETFVNRPTDHGSSHRSAELLTDGLVVQSHGQMRNFSGRAYLPKLLPSGFNIDQIK